MLRLINPLDLVGNARIVSGWKQERKERFEEWKPKMDRERVLISHHQVYLSEEFRIKALLPLVEADSDFAIAYERTSGISTLELLLGINSPRTDSINFSFNQPNRYEVPANKLEEGSVKDNIIQRIHDDLAFQTRRHGGSIDEDSVSGHYWNSERVTYKELKARNLKSKLEHRAVPAFRAADLLKYMNETGFERYEDTAIRKGNGENVLVFWQTVKELEPYAHLFPKDGSSGDDKKRKRDLKKKSEAQLKPAWI